MHPSRGLDLIDKVIEIDQSPIGRTPRSNPATYTQVFTPIRDLYAMLPESRERGYKPGRFSFNVKGGRCEACQGDGLKRIEMNFLPDVYVTCDVCRGRRYNHETLQVKYKGYSIADLLEMPVEDALKVLENIPQIKAKLETLVRVGLGICTWANPRPRFRAAKPSASSWRKSSASGRPARRSIFWTSRPPACTSRTCSKLLDVLQNLVELGNTVVVIEHQSGRDQDRRLDHRPGTGGRRAGRGRGGVRNAGADSAEYQELHGAGAAQDAGQRTRGVQ